MREFLELVKDVHGGFMFFPVLSSISISLGMNLCMDFIIIYLMYNLYVNNVFICFNYSADECINEMEYSTFIICICAVCTIAMYVVFVFLRLVIPCSSVAIDI